jgi:hypothetical protein
MDRQGCTGDTMAGRSQSLQWWLGREGTKTTENKNIGPVGLYFFSSHRNISFFRQTPFILQKINISQLTLFISTLV